MYVRNPFTWDIYDLLFNVWSSVLPAAVWEPCYAPQCIVKDKHMGEQKKEWEQRC